MKQEIHELILSSIDLMSIVRRATTKEELEDIFECIISTSNGRYKEDAIIIKGLLLQIIEL